MEEGGRDADGAGCIAAADFYTERAQPWMPPPASPVPSVSNAAQSDSNYDEEQALADDTGDEGSSLSSDSEYGAR